MKLLLVTFLLLFSACSIKNYEHTETKIVTIKTPKIKFSDIAYLRHTDNALELELFVAGNVFKKITINHLICVSGEGCMSKRAFNDRYLSRAYPEDFLQNLLLGKKIFGGADMQKSSSGFIQSILTQDVDIKYRVKTKSIYFKDRKNHILFKIKDVE
jgi:hypothetical protein